jgi:TrmH family RNA methyltransferase
VSDEVGRLATLKVTIPMPGDAESLNVAAAAAVCFYEANRGSGRRET